MGDLLATVDGLLIDIDGVLVRGSEVIPGAAEALQSLRARQIPLRFVTNTTVYSRHSLLERMVARGFLMEAPSGDYFSGWPIVTVSLPTFSTSHSILSPATTAATPDGVPVMMRSPAASSTISDSLLIVSGTFQIS